MNLTCPNCGARFKINDDVLGTKGRKVKCGKCEHRWRAMPKMEAPPAPADPTEDFVPPPPPPPVAQAPVSEHKETEETGVPDQMLGDPPPIPPKSEVLQGNRAPKQKRGGTMKYWMLLLLLVGVSVGGFVWRDMVVHFFPPANKVFMMIGFPANTLGYGLKIFEPKTFLDMKNENRVLGVTGQIMNETGKVIEVPLLKAILIGAKGEDMASWSFNAKAAHILPGEKIDYKTSIEKPPSGVTGLRITFTRAEEEAMGDKMAPKDKSK